MRYSRSGIIFALVAAEIVIGGMILSVLGFGHHPGWNGRVQAATLSAQRFIPAAVAPIDAGDRPHVVVDDSQSRIVVTASTDGLVHVTDQTSVGGSAWGSGQISQLRVTHDGSSVSIVRPGETRHNVFFLFGGWAVNRVTIQLPAGASLEIAHCSGADVANLNGSVNVRSQDGHITLDSLGGTVDVATDDGSIQARNVHGHAVTLATSDGHLQLDDVSAAALVATTNDGSISATGLRLDGSGATGRLHSDDGRIGLAFDGPGNVTVRAHTGDGRISVNGDRRRGDDDSADGTYTLGDGSSGTLDVSTQDGSIAMTTNGAQ